MAGDSGAGGHCWVTLLGQWRHCVGQPRASRVSHGAVGHVVARTMPITMAALVQRCSALPWKPAAVALCLVVGMRHHGFNTTHLWATLGPWRSLSVVAGGPSCGGHGSTPRWRGMVTLAQLWCTCARSDHALLCIVGCLVVGRVGVCVGVQLTHLVHRSWRTGSWLP